MDDHRIVAAIFDFDGTLIDSDEALVAPFLALGVPRERISFGHAIAPECNRLGIPIDAYVKNYDTDATRPFPGVPELVDRLSRWAICSNKHPLSATAEVARLGWQPEVALYADAFGWEHKSLGPVLDAMGLDAGQVVMVGDSDGDRLCAEEVGCEMIWAGWNPRVREVSPAGEILDQPGDLLDRFPGLRRLG